MYVTRNADNLLPINIRHNFYKNSYFPSTIIEYNNVDSSLRNSENFGVFKNNILKQFFLTTVILRGLG